MEEVHLEVMTSFSIIINPAISVYHIKILKMDLGANSPQANQILAAAGSDWELECCVTSLGDHLT